MSLLWDESLKMNTVHVQDVARAAIWLCQKGKLNQIYHLADSGCSTQGSLMKIISDIFDIKYEFWGNIKSKLAMIDESGVVEAVNETTLEPWARMCSAKELFNTPLTPYIGAEALSNKHLHLDSSKIKNEGYCLSVSAPDKAALVEVFESIENYLSKILLRFFYTGLGRLYRNETASQ